MFLSTSIDIAIGYQRRDDADEITLCCLNQRTDFGGFCWGYEEGSEDEAEGHDKEGDEEGEEEEEERAGTTRGKTSASEMELGVSPSAPRWIHMCLLNNPNETIMQFPDLEAAAACLQYKNTKRIEWALEGKPFKNGALTPHPLIHTYPYSPPHPHPDSHISPCTYMLKLLLIL